MVILKSGDLNLWLAPVFDGVDQKLVEHVYESFRISIYGHGWAVDPDGKPRVDEKVLVVFDGSVQEAAQIGFLDLDVDDVRFEFGEQKQLAELPVHRLRGEADGLVKCGFITKGNRVEAGFKLVNDAVDVVFQLAVAFVFLPESRFQNTDVVGVDALVDVRGELAGNTAWIHPGAVDFFVSDVFFDLNRHETNRPEEKEERVKIHQIEKTDLAQQKDRVQIEGDQHKKGEDHTT